MTKRLILKIFLCLFAVNLVAQDYHEADNFYRKYDHHKKNKHTKYYKKKQNNLTQPNEIIKDIIEQENETIIDNNKSITNLSDTVKISIQNQFDIKFNYLRQQQALDKSKPLVSFIKEDDTEELTKANLRPLMRNGYDKKYYTQNDIEWIIKNKDTRPLFYNIFIIEALKDPVRKERLFELITPLEIIQEKTTSTVRKSHSRQNNILIEIIELKNTDISKKINILEDFLREYLDKDLLNIESAKRMERKTDGTYEEKTYTLLGWLMRSKNNYEQYHVSRNNCSFYFYAHYNENYIKILKMLTEYEYNKQDKKFGGEFLSAFSLLKQQNDIDENITIEDVIKRIENIDNIIFSSILNNQIKIGELLEVYNPELSLKWQELLNK